MPNITVLTGIAYVGQDEKKFCLAACTVCGKFIFVVINVYMVAVA